MKKPIKIILILTMLLIVQRSVNAYSNIPKDMHFGKCVEFQQSSPENVTGDGYFNHCIKANCENGQWRLSYFKNSSLPFCLNGNRMKYSQIVASGCGFYSGYCDGSIRESYCGIVTYYDCSRTITGMSYPPVTPTTTTTTTTTKAITTTTTTTRRTTRKSNTTTKPTTTTTTAISSNNYIGSLIIEGHNINFNRDITEYTINVSDDVKSLNIMVVLEDDKASYEITDNENIDVNIPVKITVTAENEQIRVYSINVKKDNEILDSNSKLAIFKITGKNIEFDPNVLNYNITIEGETELDIFVLPESDKATYHISGNENLKNKSKITITVKAEDGTESKYTINVKTPSNVDAILIISLISIVAIFVGYKVFRKIFFKEKETTYEYE